MILLPAIDLYEGKVVRLTRGDYGNMTVYRDDPAAQAAEFQAAGAVWLHTVDLEGARDGGTPNFEVIRQICRTTGLKVEIGGGIRSEEAVGKRDECRRDPRKIEIKKDPINTRDRVGK